MNQTRDSVLFVDDEPEVLNALKRLLEDEPYEVRTCEDPVRALQEIVADGPSVVVADYYMPRMKGPRFLKRVRELDESIVRIVLTGKPDVDAVLESVRLGSVYRFILKPWDEDEIRVTIDKAIEYGKLLREKQRLREAYDRQRQTLETLEASHPGITKLPREAITGALALTPDDLPEGTD